MFLITTADQRFWKTEGPVLFLGEWCKTYDKRDVWKNREGDVLPYHWDDRGRLYRDYNYVSEVYETYLEALTTRLNVLHKINASARFWRIVVGPWLRYFIETFYDRFLSIQGAIAHGGASETWIADTSVWDPPRDFAEFNRWLSSDTYNQFIYSWLIERTKQLPFRLVDSIQPHSPLQLTSAGRQILPRLAAVAGRCIPSWFNRIVLAATVLPTTALIRLQSSLGQLPFLLTPQIDINSTGVKADQRDELAMRIGRNEFERCLDSVIPIQIPLAYVESFSEISKRALRSFPKRPSAILTSNAESFDEGFKVWAASHVDRNVTFLMAQHGGHYGAGRWSSAEDHQVKISDRYYSWGWRPVGPSNVKPMPALRLVNIHRSIRWCDSGRILWALTSIPRYAYRMFSIPVAAGQFEHYLDQQFLLASALPPEVRKRILLRLNPEEYGWNEKSRWTDRFPDICTYQGQHPMHKQFCESSLFIGTYNATTFLESMAADFPTIIFWDPVHWELRGEAEPEYGILQDAGIFHTTPESAAAKVLEVEEDPMRWWREAKVQKAKNRFCDLFAKTNPRWISEWRSELRALLSKGEAPNEGK